MHVTTHHQRRRRLRHVVRNIDVTSLIAAGDRTFVEDENIRLLNQYRMSRLSCSDNGRYPGLRRRPLT